MKSSGAVVDVAGPVSDGGQKVRRREGGKERRGEGGKERRGEGGKERRGEGGRGKGEGGRGKGEGRGRGKGEGGREKGKRRRRGKGKGLRVERVTTIFSYYFLIYFVIILQVELTNYSGASASRFLSTSELPPFLFPQGSSFCLVLFV